MMMFQWLKRKSDRSANAQKLYQAALFQSRHPDFYKVLDVPDSMDGRFDLLSLHVFLMMRRLNECGAEGCALAQALFDAMFRRMDLDLREMGVGDLGVPKHMKRMMTAFHGRASVYNQCLNENNHDGLQKAITRNLYKADGEIRNAAQSMADYMMASNDKFKDMPDKDVMGGVFDFPPVSSLGSKIKMQGA